MTASVGTSVITRVESGHPKERVELLAVEEPLDIRLQYGPEDERAETRLGISMRTPGQDQDLVLGLLHSEGIIRNRDQVRRIWHCQQTEGEASGNVMKVSLSPEIELDPRHLDRKFAATASCGICGQRSLEAVKAILPGKLPPIQPMIPLALLHTLPDKLAEQQAAFRHTGGMHAAAWFDWKGNLMLLREDIGRHNALDKLIGAALQLDALPLHQGMLLLSGRIGFELVQKALMAGCPLVAAIGAPSSLAVSLAQAHEQCLVGFLRAHRCNIYAAPHRLSIPISPS
ncbi:MAG: formate dehydrogenase accessory sulfurtransferase FdhD [Bacteroidota bacterium]